MAFVFLSGVIALLLVKPCVGGSTATIAKELAERKAHAYRVIYGKDKSHEINRTYGQLIRELDLDYCRASIATASTATSTTVGTCHAWTVHPADNLVTWPGVHRALLAALVVTPAIDDQPPWRRSICSTSRPGHGQVGPPVAARHSATTGGRPGWSGRPAQHQPMRRDAFNWARKDAGWSGSAPMRPTREHARHMLLDQTYGLGGVCRTCKRERRIFHLEGTMEQQHRAPQPDRLVLMTVDQTMREQGVGKQRALIRR
jgi:hypothetical protein